MSVIPYDKSHHEQDAQRSLESARVLLNYLFTFWAPKNVIDFGCGLGTWLVVCKELGVRHLVGLDGDWVRQDMMLDPIISFRPTNLQKEVSLAEDYELALSLEVAEHLAPEAADKFVRSLTRSAAAIVFSAAFTGQPGANHVNTRPHSYWANKFLSHGYLLFDIFRPEFWSDERVEPWYRQNTFLYVKADHPLHHALIKDGHRPLRDARFVDCIHPWLYFWIYNALQTRMHLAQPANTEISVGRNSPCHCGSGKKYKHCHGRLL